MPIGLAAAEDGDFRSIRRFAERDHARIVSWTELAGVFGHYSAHTNPDQLAVDIRRFFRPLRPTPSTTRMTAMPEHTWTVITESLDLLRRGAASIDETERGAPTPCREWTVTQVLQHAVGDQLAWAAAIGVGPGPSEKPFTPSGRLEGSIDDLVEPALRTAHTAWAGIGDDDAVPTPLPQGPHPAPTAAAACALDAAVHAWDIAAALGLPAPVSDELAGQLLPAAHAIVEPLRTFGAYAPALPPEACAGNLAELLRFLGRNPEWTAER